YSFAAPSAARNLSSDTRQKSCCTPSTRVTGIVSQYSRISSADCVISRSTHVTSRSSATLRTTSRASSQRWQPGRLSSVIRGAAGLTSATVTLALIGGRRPIRRVIPWGTSLRLRSRLSLLAPRRSLAWPGCLRIGVPSVALAVPLGLASVVVLAVVLASRLVLAVVLASVCVLLTVLAAAVGVCAPACLVSPRFLGASA